MNIAIIDVDIVTVDVKTVITHLNIVIVDVFSILKQNAACVQSSVA